MAAVREVPQKPRRDSTSLHTNVAHVNSCRPSPSPSTHIPATITIAAKCNRVLDVIEAAAAVARDCDDNPQPASECVCVCGGGDEGAQLREEEGVVEGANRPE